jgi:hypothetical protein
LPYEYEWTGHGIEWRMYGVVVLGDLIDAVSRFCGDPRSEHARYRLMDLRDATTTEVSDFDLAYLGAFDKVQSFSTPHVRTAFILPEGRFHALVAKYSAMLAGSTWEACSFSEESSARAWAQASSRGPSGGKRTPSAPGGSPRTESSR